MMSFGLGRLFSGPKKSPDTLDSNTAMDTNDNGGRRPAGVHEPPTTSSGTGLTETGATSTPASPESPNKTQAQDSLNRAPNMMEDPDLDPSDALSLQESIAAASKVRAREPPAVARPRIDTPPAAFRAGIQSLFGGQVKRTASFFTFRQPPPTARSVQATGEVQSKKRKAFDPFQTELLHCSELDDLSKRQKLGERGAASKTRPGSSQASTAKDRRADPKDISALETDRAAMTPRPGRERANSVSGVTSKNEIPTSVFEKLMSTPRNTQPTNRATPRASTKADPSSPVSNDAALLRQQISAAMVKGKKPPSRPWKRGAASTTSSHHSSSVRALHSGKHRLPGSPKRKARSNQPPPPAKASSRPPPAPVPHEVIEVLSSDDDANLRGFIGSGADRRPDRRPEYTYAQKTTLDRMLERTRQTEKLKAADKHVAQQSPQRPYKAPVIDTNKLLAAKGVSGWKQAEAQGNRDDSTPSPGPESSIDVPEQPVPVQQNRTEAPVESNERRTAQPSGSQSWRMPPRLHKSDAYLRMRNNVVDEDEDDMPVPAGHRQLQRPPTRSGAPQPPRPQPPPGALQKKPGLTRESIKQAVAQMANIQSQVVHRPPPRIVDKVPPGLGEQEHPEIRRARQLQLQKQGQIGKELRQADQISEDIRLYDRQKRELRTKVGKEYPDASDEFKQQAIKKRLEEYVLRRETKRMNDQRKFSKNLVRSALEDIANGQGQDEHSEGQQDDQAPQPGGSKVPASEILKDREIPLYRVHISDPYSKGNNDPTYYSTKEFGRLHDAENYLTELLHDRTPPKNSRRFDKTPSKASQKCQEQDFESLRFGKHEDGLPWGEKKLRGGAASGKFLSAYVQKVKQLGGDLAPDTLRRLYVDKELADKFAPLRYDVILVNMAPKAFKKEELLRKRQQDESRMDITGEQSAAEEIAGAQTGEDSGLTGDDVRKKLADGGWSADVRNDEENSAGERSSSRESPQASDDEDQSAESEVDLSPGSDAYSTSPMDNEYDMHRHMLQLKSFTTRDLAKQYALVVAKENWKSKRPQDLDAREHYTTKVLPYLAEQDAHIDSDDDEQLTLNFPECERRRGKAAYRIWGFTDSQVLVKKSKLEGPVDLDISFVQNANEFVAEDIRNAVNAMEEDEEQTLRLAALRRKLKLQAHEPATRARLEDGNSGEEVDESGEEQSGQESDYSEED